MLVPSMNEAQFQIDTELAIDVLKYPGFFQLEE